MLTAPNARLLARHRPVRPRPLHAHRLRRAHGAAGRLRLGLRRRHHRPRPGRRQRLFRRAVRSDLPAHHGRGDGVSRSSSWRWRWSRSSAPARRTSSSPSPSPSSRAAPAWCDRARWRSARRPIIDAARACGFSHTRIVLRHMVPNVMAPYLDHDDGRRRPGDPDRGVAVVSGPRRAGADAGLGPDAARRRAGVCRERALGGDLSRASPSPLPCSASTCSATPCATGSTPR